VLRAATEESSKREEYNRFSVNNVIADVAKAMGDIGPDAQAASPALKSALLSLGGIGGNIAVREATAEALGKIKALATLREVLREGDIEIRKVATQAIGEIGPAAAPAAPDLVKASEDRDYAISRNAIDAIVKIGPAAVPALREALRGNTFGKVPRGAIEALIKIGNKDAVDALKWALDNIELSDKDRKWIEKSIEEIEAKEEESALPKDARIAAILELGRSGGPGVAQKLYDMTFDESDWDIAEAAVGAYQALIARGLNLTVVGRTDPTRAAKEPKPTPPAALALTAEPAQTEIYPLESWLPVLGDNVVVAENYSMGFSPPELLQGIPNDIPANPSPAAPAIEQNALAGGEVIADIGGGGGPPDGGAL